METPVSVNVGPSGAATATIAIEVPPGTAGMVPSLSLNYNSQSGNGLLGLGWSLGGLSAITRCAKTKLQDNTNALVEPPTFVSTDKYCLDGQPLIVVPGSGAYGANNTEYRTERESFTKIVSYVTGSGSSTGPSYFKAWTKSGQIMEFGNSADSAIEAVYVPSANPVNDTANASKNDIRVWAVNKISDTVGNYLTVTYTEDTKAMLTGDYRPSRIDYTGHGGTTAVTPYNSVRFVYQTRTDKVPIFQGGAVVEVAQRLTNIQTWTKKNAAEFLVKDYRIHYEGNLAAELPSLSRIDKISECDGTATTATCFNTTVTWKPAPVQKLTVQTANYNNNIPAMEFNMNSAYNRFADFNGDGKTDYLYVPNANVYHTLEYWLIAYGMDQGFGVPKDAIKTLSTGESAIPSAPQYMQFGDFNGDGKPDYMWQPKNGDGRWLVAYATDTGFTTPTYGTPAIPATVNNQGVASIYLNRSSTAEYMQIGDFNGDGKDDYMWSPGNGDGRWLIAYANSNGDGFVVPDYSTPAWNMTLASGIAPLPTSVASMKFADFNGDGKLDYLWRTSTGWYLAYATDAGFELPVRQLYNFIMSGYLTGFYTYTDISRSQQFHDFNGDGKTDYMFLTVSLFGLQQGPPDSWKISYSSNSGLSAPVTVIPPNSNSAASFGATDQDQAFYDFNGDGKTDYMYRPSGQGYWNIAYSTGTGFTAPVTVIPANSTEPVYASNPEEQKFLDFNGDGKIDYVYAPAGKNYWNIAYGTGTGFTSPTLLISNPVLPSSAVPISVVNNVPQWARFAEQFTDFNGDGKPDYVVLSNWYWNTFVSSPQDLLVKSITTGVLNNGVCSNGLCTTTQLEYLPLTDKTVYGGRSVYTKDSGTTAPYMDLIAPMYVVSKATAPDGVGGTRDSTYHYYGAKIHRKGGGYMGFRQFDVTDSASQITTSDEFSQSYPFQGLPWRTTTRQSNGNILKQVTNTWNVRTFPDTVGTATTDVLTGFDEKYGNKHLFPYVTSTLEQTYEADGSGPVSQVKTETALSDVDDYGNAKKVTTTTLDGYSKVTDSQYWNDPNNWLIGRLIKSTVTSTAPDNPVVSPTAANGDRTGGFGTYPTPTGGISTLMTIINSLLLD
jgi:hypothetical protein